MVWFLLEVRTLLDFGRKANYNLGEARRLVQQGSSGLYVNNVPVKDVQAKLEPEHLLNGQFFVMRAGKSNHKIVVLEPK